MLQFIFRFSDNATRLLPLRRGHSSSDLHNVGFTCKVGWRGLGDSQGRAKRLCQVEALVMLSVLIAN
jgi:hypothetical protein